MAGLVFGLFSLSVILLVATFGTIMAVQKTASYPPKHVLRKRAATFGFSAVMVFFLAFILYYVT
ncbi:hypothetical protein ACFOU2_09910 [Bacillus songklensis]|uniref:Uncharacterized protein n=1 Tax=Bacillus songklensis TaxID=1069116 RepID=A0ABV8B3Q7_9BACI